MPNFWHDFIFYLFGLIAIASSLAFVTRKSPVSAALWLVNTMFALAALFVMLDAHFVGAIQVLVYAGAIMVVFLFVVMLLNLGHPEEIADVRGRKASLVAGALGIVMLALIGSLLRGRFSDALRVPEHVLAEQAARAGTVGVVAEPLFTQYLLPFEVTSVLLLVAILGAVVIGKRRS